MANSRSASSLVGTADVRNLLVDLEGARGFFSGKLIDYRMPCTASEDRTCQIVANLSVWNEFLRPLQLELRELPETGRQLGLINIDIGNVSAPPIDQLRQAATVLYWLLSTHHCVAQIHFGRMFASRPTAHLCLPVLCETLEGNYSLKSVVLEYRSFGKLKSEEVEKILKIVSSLKCLEELEFPHQYSSLCSRSVSAILRSTTTLTVLDWTFAQGIEPTQARQFLTALSTNSTLRDLSLSARVISADPTLFFEFLTGDARLQNLRVVSPIFLPSHSLTWILKGMVKNRSVSSLQVENIALDFESVEIASKVLAENRVLRSFRLSTGTSATETAARYGLRFEMPSNTTALQDAIARNDTLQYMTLSFSIWCAEHWGPFFRVLSKHTSLKMVTIDVEEEKYRLLPGVLEALQESGCVEKVNFRAPHISQELTVADCKAVCEHRLKVSDTAKDRQLPFFQQLSTFPRLKELRLIIVNWDCTIFSAFSEYVAMTTTLRKLHVNFRLEFAARELIEWWPALSRSLLLNKSIAELAIGVVVESRQNIEMLGDALRRSSTIRKLILMEFSYLASNAFVEGLCADILKNYTLCKVAMDYWMWLNSEAYWVALWDASRRNSGFVARAAQFLNHARCDRLCAAALDRVSRHPALVAELAEVLSIGEEEAARRVRQRFRSIEGLHEFMRLAGVVKQRVTCRPSEDGRAQLDDLNSECWCHVRRYLQLDDVAFD
ncbi:uncharacterized protein [Dermacentor andersoni]|uniref:uncharacterized protein n=1 Tax=Dermacentor andersoni TaxID=34620 RepID=UPI0021550046|nr:uncharacterized protein LOC126529183 isoform X1 [Dermacentor andersoni]XP_054925645.1 uncharacterized protein LOC126529183 isoform X1 [Dermacentor andersoni]